MAESKETAESKKMDDPLTLEAGTPVVEAREKLKKWLRGLDLQRKFKEVLRCYSLFEKKLVTFQFNVKAPEYQIAREGNTITVNHSFIEKAPQYRPGNTCSGHQIKAALRGVINETLVRPSDKDLLKSGFDQDALTNDMFNRIMAEWLAIPDIPVERDVAFGYDAEGQNIIVDKNEKGLNIHISTIN